MGKAARSTTVPPPSITEILKGSEYALTIFTANEIKALKVIDKGGKPYLVCFATDKERPAKPEEIVRQLYIKKLIDNYGYPKDRLRIEKDVYFGSTVHEKRADIVVIEKDTPDTPYIIVECKKAKRKDGLEQLKSYCNAEGAPIGLWTNGSSTIGLHREDPNLFRELPDLPTATQTLADMLNTPWTIDDLERENILVVERTSLKDVILNMEDLVLANAGVDGHVTQGLRRAIKQIHARDVQHSQTPSRSFIGPDTPRSRADSTTPHRWSLRQARSLRAGTLP